MRLPAGRHQDVVHIRFSRVLFPSAVPLTCHSVDVTELAETRATVIVLGAGEDYECPGRPRCAEVLQRNRETDRPRGCTTQRVYSVSLDWHICGEGFAGGVFNTNASAYEYQPLICVSLIQCVPDIHGHVDSTGSPDSVLIDCDCCIGELESVLRMPARINERMEG